MILIASQSGATNRQHILRMLSLLGGKPKRRRPPPPIFPRQAEREYLRILLEITDQMELVVSRGLRQELPSVLEEAKADRPVADSVHLDAWANRIQEIVDALRATMVGIFDETALAALLKNIGERISKLNAVHQNKFMRAVLGVDVLASEPWLVSQMEKFVTTNVNLIKGLENQYIGDVQKIIFDGASRGLRHEEIAQQLRDRPHLRLQNRAAFIARDQVSKFNSDLARARQTQVGIKAYFWRGILDERERPEHVSREGQRYTWDQPPAGGDHPGHEPGCRCSAEPDMTPFFDGDEEAA